MLRRRLRSRQGVETSSTAGPRVIYGDDAFIVSYPRSGSAWLRRLIAQVRDPSSDISVTQIEKYVPDIYAAGAALEESPRPRVMKSHEPYTAAYPRVVYLVRDGRDVAVSYYDFHRALHGYTGSFGDFVERFLTGQGGGFGRWADHVRSWVPARPGRPFHVVRYEDLHQRPLEALRGVADFLGFDGSADRISTALARCRFDAHQEDVRVNRPDLYAKGYRGGVAGGPGAWRRHFTPDMDERFWSVAGEAMTVLGYVRDGQRQA
jgi:hypothetical protein